MNKTLKFCVCLLLAVLSVGFNACKKEEPVKTPKVELLENEIVIDTTRVTVFAKISDDGGGTIAKKGFVYGIAGERNDTVFCSGERFSSLLDNLSPNTTYNYSAFAFNEAGAGRSDVLTFTTLEWIEPHPDPDPNPDPDPDPDPEPEPTPNDTLAMVTTLPIDSVGLTMAWGGVEVIDDGGATVTECGLCWATSHNPTLDDSHVAAGEGTGIFSCEITGLEPNKIYYARAYAINANGTAYGEDVRFVTNGIFVADVVTYSVSEITTTTAKVSGEVFDDGGAEVSERGVCWSTHSETTIDDNRVANGSGLGYFVCTLTGLESNTAYYARAYAINSEGVSYGEELRFSTLQMVELPTVITTTITAITQNAATGVGNVVSDGNAEVTARGLCWSTHQNPTLEDSQVECGSGMGIFSANMTNLTPNTTYYVRAYAVNSAGIFFGNELDFTTLQNVELPIVITMPVSDITGTSATGSGNVISDGGETVITRGLCWSTQPNPTLSDHHTSSGSGTGVFSVGMTGLSAATTYYVRAYATNSLGTAYGDEVNFTTSSSWGEGQLPGLFSVNAAIRVRFSQGNLQYQASSNTWRFADNQFDYIGDGNANISETYSGWIDLFGWGTSGYNHGANSYQPWSTSAAWSDYYAYGDAYSSLYDQTGQADWGYNAISNGGNNTNIWRTLTQAEWRYLFDFRNTTSGIRYAKAIVNGVNGVLLLPDDWQSGTYALISTNVATAPFTENVVSASDWAILEENGVVFLPAAGYRIGTQMFSIGAEGNYWTSSRYDNYDVFYMRVFDSNLDPNSIYGREFGRSVRLVTPGR